MNKLNDLINIFNNKDSEYIENIKNNIKEFNNINKQSALYDIFDNNKEFI